MDLFTGEIVSWSISIRHTTEFVIEACLDAVKTTERSVIVHTDQGSEYNSEDYSKFMEELGVRISISAKGSSWENATRKVYMTTLKPT